MKQFIAFVRKEFHHILRDRRTMLILIGMPIVQIILFGFAISTEVRNVQTAILAPSLQTDVRKVMEELDASEYFTVKYVVQSPDEIERLFRRNLIELAVVFPSDLHRLRFDSEEIQILADATDPNLAVTRSTYAQTILRQAMQTLRQTTTTSAYSQPDKQPVMVYNKLLYNPQMKSAYNFVPGIMGLIFILICAIMTSVSIVREKETGTMEVLLVSPVRPIRIVFAKMIPYFVLSCLNLASILLLARFVLGVPMSGGIVGIVGLSLLYIVLALALGLFISTVARTQVTALLVSAMLMLMPMIMLSGMVFPIGNMPAPLRWLSCIVPARWYIAAIRRLMIEGLPFTAVLREFAILAAMTAGLIAVALRKFNDKLE